MKKKDQVAAEILCGDRTCPMHLQPKVREYQRLAMIVDNCESYPRSVDDQMNELHDRIVDSL